MTYTKSGLADRYASPNLDVNFTAKDVLVEFYRLGFMVTEHRNIEFKGYSKPLTKDTQGYLCYRTKVRFSEKRRNVKLHVHRLAAYQKFGELMFHDGILVRHLNGDKLDNRAFNLELGTDHDNRMDMHPAVRLQLSVQAASRHRRYSDERVGEMFKMKAEGKTQKEICEKFGMAKSVVSYILHRASYSHGGETAAKYRG